MEDPPGRRRIVLEEAEGNLPPTVWRAFLAPCWVLLLDPPYPRNYTQAGPGCSAVGSAPRLGRGGRRFKSAHPDYRARESRTSLPGLGRALEWGRAEFRGDVLRARTLQAGRFLAAVVRSASGSSNGSGGAGAVEGQRVTGGGRGQGSLS